MRHPHALIVTLFAGLFVLFCSPPIHAQTQTVINYADVWKYNIPTLDPGVAWRALAYDDTQPLNGVNWVGSGGSNIGGLYGYESATLPTPGLRTSVGSQNGQMVYLFRKTFTYTGDPVGATLQIDQIADDGVIYYLNGNLLGSDNQTLGGAWNASADVGIGDGFEKLKVVNGPATGLINGTNVLCAEVHQYGATSTDMCFGARLKVTPYVPPTPGTIEHVIYISVDGLRGHFIQNFIESSPANFPNFVRLRNTSAFTYNARCDYTRSVTVPNHICMITGRPVEQITGLANTWHHGYVENFPAPGDTIHAQGNPAAPYKSSVFDVVHDRGKSTALYADKVRLTLLNISYDENNGAVDSVGANNGKDKIDFAQIVDYTPAALTATLASHIGGSLESYSFVHFGIVDQAGHATGWSTTPGSDYYNAAKTIDTHLGTILNAIEANPAISNKVVLVLCADHGGGSPTEFTNHSHPLSVENYTIPMFVRGPGFAAGSDLYSYFENRTNPGTGRPSYTDPGQPLRNGDAANLSTTLLGLPQIPGSYMMPEFKRKFVMTHGTNSITMTWPDYLTGYSLEYTDDLTVGDLNWTKVTTGITQTGGVKTYTHTFPPPNARFFRIRKP